jgi:hypothetical protein
MQEEQRTAEMTEGKIFMSTDYGDFKGDYDRAAGTPHGMGGGRRAIYIMILYICIYIFLA